MPASKIASNDGPNNDVRMQYVKFHIC